MTMPYGCVASWAFSRAIRRRTSANRSASFNAEPLQIVLVNPFSRKTELQRELHSGRILFQNGLQSLFGKFLCARSSCEDQIGPFNTYFREADSFAGERFRPAGIGVAKENAVHWMRSGETRFCVLAGRGHEHGMAAAENAHLNGIHVQFGQQLLKVGEDARGESFAIILVEQSEAMCRAE